MTHRERVVKAFNNEPVDRIPMSFWFHFLEHEDTVDGLANPDLLDLSYKRHQEYIKIVHPDFVKIMSDGLFLYPCDNLHGIRTANDLLRIQAIDRSNPWIQAQVKHVNRIVSIEKDACYYYNIFSPSMLLRIVLGYEVFSTLFNEDRQALKQALIRMGEGIANLAEAVIEEGKADGIYFCVQNHNSEAVSDDEYREIFSTSDLLVLSAANSRSLTGNILHVCGYKGVRNRLAFFAGYDSKAVNWAASVEGVSLKDGKALFGNRAVVGGLPNTNTGILYTGSKEELELFIEKIIEDSGKTGLILAADCSLPFDINWERLLWVKEKLSIIH